MPPEKRRTLALTHLVRELTVLIEMGSLQPAIVEQLFLMPERPPSTENIRCTGREHRPREWIGERAGVFPTLEEVQVVTFER